MTDGLNVNVVAVLRSNEAVPAFNEACGGVNGHRIEVQVAPLGEVRPGGAFSIVPDVLVLDVDPRDAGEVEQLRGIMERHYPGTPVVATTPDTGLQSVRQLMHLGAVDVLPQPVQKADLHSAIDHAARRRLQKAAPAPKFGGKVISFLKGGGGVGATTLAVQAGTALAGRYKAEEPQVCLLDWDVQFGTAALYLDLPDQMGLANLLESAERLDNDLFRSVMASHESKLDLMAAPRDLMPLEAIEPDAASNILKRARENYRFTLLDLPEVWTSWSYQLLQESDLILVVTQFTVGGVRQTRRQLDALQAQGLENVPLKVVLNRFEKGWGKTGMIKEAEQGLGRPIDYFVANDYKTVSEAINQGVCLHKIKTKTKVEKSLREMIEQATAVFEEDEVRAEPRLSL
jgi:pilus assembly protein CpaE